MEGHGWAEREESDVGSRELSVHSYGQKQCNPVWKGWHELPQPPVMALCWEHAGQFGIFRKCLFRPHTLALSRSQSCSLTDLPVLPSLVCEGIVSQ